MSGDMNIGENASSAAGAGSIGDASDLPSAGARPKLRLEWVEAGSLSPNPRNWRRHPPGQVAALQRLIGDADVGWAGALLFNERTGHLIDGHARQKVVEPSELVPVLIGSWSEEAEQKILLTLDPIAGMALADLAKIETLLRDVDLSEDYFADLRLQLDEMVERTESLLALEDQATEIIEDQVPEPPDEAITRPGDLWILRNANGIEHRLLCGDSASAADVDRLLVDDSRPGAILPVHLVNTDPPYNVKVEPRSNNAIAAGLSSFTGEAPSHRERHNSRMLSALRAKTATHHQGFDLARRPGVAVPTHSKLRPKDRPLANDFVSDEEFDRLLYAWFGNLARVLLPGRGFYIWGGYANVANYPPVLKACGLYFSQAIIWVKEHPVLTRKDYMGNHEWCFYGWREGAAHEFFGPNNAPDVWSIKKVNPQSMIHLTEKPVELAARAMQYSSRPGENVLDLFGGSGSTLIAAEQTGRRAFLMELDPLYCDVVVQRWEKFTGRKAERFSGRRDAPVIAEASGQRG
ncbi:MAG: DNA modification methylase [Phycisphaerae bacterium]